MIATGVQLKAARELLGWSQRDLAERVAFGPGGHPSTVKYWERNPAIPTGQREPAAVRNFRHAFEAAGVRFWAGGETLGIQWAQVVPHMQEAAE